MGSVTAYAFGKINLTLDVLRKRDDGFHDIRSLMVSVGLADDLVVESLPGGNIEITCDSPRIPCDETNLIHRAAVALRKDAGVDLGCRVHLTKRIPVGAGMGGGSSDAASTLIALNELWELGLDRTHLAKVGAEIGSDVPFFFSPGAAIVTGRGERIEPVEMKWSGWAGLVSSGDHVSTPDVYARCKPSGDVHGQSGHEAIAKCATSEEISPLLRNDLETSVYEVAPGVRALRDELIRSGIAQDTLRVTGAGSVLFQLFDDESSANRFAANAMSCANAVAAWSVQVPAPTSIPVGR
ncbi:MAG: 4-(cytidine 5'-diphospho)-2-C-methyl-D-erythritol kinase [Planctomycetes bacterium]|nr:4-(cytidine 5'-diphospho)-2-C-methyl-D-erythritol kinase [Planctomycetota bacterium]